MKTKKEYTLDIKDIRIACANYVDNSRTPDGVDVYILLPNDEKIWVTKDGDYAIKCIVTFIDED